MILDLVVFLLVLGLLIFFHELGHFLAAKACGIYCDRFSLGMPPRLFGVRLGETDYCLGALPLGGYVKMAGQEDVPMDDEERQETYAHVPPERWFNNRPLWQRFIVILAGPLMNLVLAVILYGVIAAVGAWVPEAEVDNRIGMVLPDSPAARAPMYLMTDDKQKVDLSAAPDAVGWQTGDRIATINDDTMTSIKDVAIDAILSAGKPLDVVVERARADGSLARYLSPVKPEAMVEDGYVRFGVDQFETALIDHVMAGTPAKDGGLKEGDIILRANGALTDRATFIKAVEAIPEGETLTLDIQRDSQTLEIALQPRTIGRFRGLATAPQMDFATHATDDAQPTVVAVSDALEQNELRSTDLDRKGQGLLPGDIIEKVNGQPASVAVLHAVEYANPGATVELQVRRPAVLYGYLRDEQTVTVEVTAAPVRAIGIQFGTKMVFHRVPWVQVAPEALRQGYQAMRRTLQMVALLVTGSVSPKELGGPVMIYQVTTTAAREGYWWLLKITAFISANLCVFNLLPLPVLDGGMLLCFVIEGIRRKPLSIQFQQRIQQVGLVLIIGLVLFVTFNDVSRWVAMHLP